MSPLALSVPDIDSYLGLMPTLFTLEDRYGLTIESGENGVSPRVDPRKGKDAAEFSEMLNAWAEQPEKLRNGDISREDYDKWRYNYPKYDETSGYVKVPSQQLSDAMVEAFKDRLNGVNARIVCLFPGVSGWFSGLPSLCGCVGIRLGIWGRNRWRCPIVKCTGFCSASYTGVSELTRV